MRRMMPRPRRDRDVQKNASRLSRDRDVRDRDYNSVVYNNLSYERENKRVLFNNLFASTALAYSQRIRMYQLSELKAPEALAQNVQLFWLLGVLGLAQLCKTLFNGQWYRSTIYCILEGYQLSNTSRPKCWAGTRNTDEQIYGQNSTKFASTLWEMKVIDKFGCMFHKHNNICGNAKITTGSQQAWPRPMKEKQHCFSVLAARALQKR